MTSRPAKLKITNKPKIQNGLEYKVLVSTIVQRSCEFFEAPWCIFQNTLKELYWAYLDRNPNHSVSWGTFLALKPFYVRTATSKDVEMCVCKLHFNARWAVKSLVNLCNENDTDLNGITDYETFLAKLTEGCDTDPYSYISWNCAPDYKTMCSSITRIWSDLKNKILSNKEATKMVPVPQFVKKPHITKKGEHIMRLESKTSEVDAEYILKFIDKRLLKIIHHRNQLKNFRNTNYIQQFIWRCCY